LFITDSTRGGDISGQCSVLLNTNPGVEKQEKAPESQSESAAMGIERVEINQLLPGNFSEELVCYLLLWNL
jgi:hypothetical protein